MTLLGAWRSELAKIDDCPWPGPRPIRTESSAESLPGRDKDAKEIARLIRGHGVVVLTGASGVGKTSALYTAVRPQLRDWEREVMLCDTWNPARDFDVATLIASQVGRDLPPEIRLGDGRPSLVEQLDEYYPDKAVIILDQFEELIRYRPRAYRKVLDWIKETARTSSVRIVISLRIEYEHELTRELKTTPFTQTRYELLPIADVQTVREIITRGTTSAGVAASKQVVNALVDAWSKTFDDSGWSEIGLLHLQATLYSLWHAKAADRVELSDVQRMWGEAVTQRDKDDVSAEVKFFELGLTTSVELALSMCNEACVGAGVDDSQAARTRELVVHLSEHLSSGGYKISLNREELAYRVLQERSSYLLRHEVSKPRERLAAMVDKAADIRNVKDIGPEYDWLSVHRSSLMRDDSARPSTDAHHPQRRRLRQRSGQWPWQLDPDDETSGALLGLRPSESAIEEMRSFHFALEWLRVCELIRVTSTEPGKSMVSLIHDRFAVGLEKWRNRQHMGIREAAARVSAMKGAVLDWSDETDNIPLVIVNARWTACRITRRFVRSTFVNCDLRGSTFKDCHFEGASFVNCLLDDVEFVGCTIAGQPSALPTTLLPNQKRDRPSFHVPAPAWVPVLNWYRESGDGNETMLFSRTAGVAAVPVSAENRHSRLIPFVDEPLDEVGDPRVPSGLGLPQPGGLTMFGGRLSSLKFRSCTFPADGWLSLRHVAGTSVELAEQREARLEVFAAALRGLTITQPISELAKHSTAAELPPAPPSFELKFNDSLVINTWFGAGLEGSAEMDNCVVWQVFNGSETFTTTLPNSLLLGGVNVDNDSAAAPIDLAPGTLDGILDQVVSGSLSIDYRHTPAKYELSSDSD